jgi:hypothetical protein
MLDERSQLYKARSHAARVNKSDHHPRVDAPIIHGSPENEVYLLGDGYPMLDFFRKRGPRNHKGIVHGFQEK